MQPDKPVIKKFYKEASCEETALGYQILLDGRAAKTALKSPLIGQNETMAKEMVLEWQSQEEVIKPTSMPVTQRQMVLLDRNIEDEARWRQVVLDYLQTDLLCYRAEQPIELVKRQADAWDEALSWFEGVYGHHLNVTSGIMNVAQDPSMTKTMEAALQKMSLQDVFALCSFTQLTGSAVLALAIVQDAISPEKAFSMSRLDETFQAEKWGEDEEAQAREAMLKQSFENDLKWFALTRG